MAVLGGVPGVGVPSTPEGQGPPAPVTASGGIGALGGVIQDLSGRAEEARKQMNLLSDSLKVPGADGFSKGAEDIIKRLGGLSSQTAEAAQKMIELAYAADKGDVSLADVGRAAEFATKHLFDMQTELVEVAGAALAVNWNMLLPRPEKLRDVSAAQHELLQNMADELANYPLLQVRMAHWLDELDKGKISIKEFAGTVLKELAGATTYAGASAVDLSIKMQALIQQFTALDKQTNQTTTTMNGAATALNNLAGPAQQAAAVINTTAGVILANNKEIASSYLAVGKAAQQANDDTTKASRGIADAAETAATRVRKAWNLPLSGSFAPGPTTMSALEGYFQTLGARI